MKFPNTTQRWLWNTCTDDCNCVNAYFIPLTQSLSVVTTGEDSSFDSSSERGSPGVSTTAWVTCGMAAPFSSALTNSVHTQIYFKL